MSKNTIGQWLKNARVGATMQSLMPSVVAVVTAIGAEGFSWWLALVAVAGVWCAHLACNLRRITNPYNNECRIANHERSKDS